MQDTRPISTGSNMHRPLVDTSLTSRDSSATSDVFVGESLKIHAAHPVVRSKATTYFETFDNGPNGWWGFTDNFQGEKSLPVKECVIASYSPWWVDYNHAPPTGAGYLQLVMGMNTVGPSSERLREFAGVNSFVQQRCSTDFRNADISILLKGEIKLQGAQLVLLVQGTIDRICSGWMLTGQPIEVSSAWSQQTITCTPDPQQWTCLGTRRDRADCYGTIPLEKILADVNTNIYLALFPVDAVPMGPISGDPHVLRAGRDYPLWQSLLPEGYVLIDSFRIDFE